MLKWIFSLTIFIYIGSIIEKYLTLQCKCKMSVEIYVMFIILHCVLCELALWLINICMWCEWMHAYELEWMYVHAFVKRRKSFDDCNICHKKTIKKVKKRCVQKSSVLLLLLTVTVGQWFLFSHGKSYYSA